MDSDEEDEEHDMNDNKQHIEQQVNDAVAEDEG